MILIHCLKHEHKEAWSELWRQYLAFYQTKRDKELFDLTFSRLIDERTECEGYIAYMDGKAVGIAHCIYHLHLWQKEKTCYLQDLFVDENGRNHGVASKLMAHVYETADDKKAEGVYWMTQEFNITAQHLYDKIGVKTPFIKYKRPE